MKKKEILRNKRGITLIALVITIIVLLILAGVTIATLMGDNGILTKASEADIKNAHATVRDSISLAYSEYQIEINASSNASIEESTKIASTQTVKIQGQEEEYLATPSMSFWDFLKTEKGYIDDNGIVNVSALTGSTLSLGNGSGTTDVYKIERQNTTYTLRYYENEETSELLWQVNQSSGEINWEEVIENAQRHEEQDPLNTDIGIGTDGQPVNLNLWKYYVKDGELHLGKLPPDTYSSDYYVGYIGEIKNGEIQGKMPQYIKIGGTTYPVKHLDITFRNLTDLEKAPELPTTTITMTGTFAGCENLKEAPTIPDSVTSMGSISVFYVYVGVFSGCVNLSGTITIPEDVTDINMLFYGCTNMNATVIINANPSDYGNAFWNTATEPDAQVIVKGNSTMLEEIVGTKSSTSNVIIEQ